jgi:hypothetical protein
VLRAKDAHPIVWYDVYSPVASKPRGLSIELGRNKAGKITFTFKNLVGVCLACIVISIYHLLYLFDITVTSSSFFVRIYSYCSLAFGLTFQVQKDKTYRICGYTEKEVRSPSSLRSSLADLPTTANANSGASSPQGYSPSPPQFNSTANYSNNANSNSATSSQIQPQSPTTASLPIHTNQSPQRKDSASKGDSVSGSPSLSSLAGKGRNIGLNHANSRTKVSRGRTGTLGGDEAGATCLFETRDGSFKSSSVMEIDGNDPTMARAVR